MSIAQHIKDAAYKLDPECWVSYSGKPKPFKQQMEVRRTLSLHHAAEDAQHRKQQATPAQVALNPWQPMTSPIDLKHIGKLLEELSEAGAAGARCQIQGIDESEPVTGKPNKLWLEEELADVQANIELNIRHFKLDRNHMAERVIKKIAHLSAWHGMLDK